MKESGKMDNSRKEKSPITMDLSIQARFIKVSSRTEKELSTQLDYQLALWELVSSAKFKFISMVLGKKIPLSTVEYSTSLKHSSTTAN